MHFYLITKNSKPSSLIDTEELELFTTAEFSDKLPSFLKVFPLEIIKKCNC